jgi:hypothetical protein
VGAGFERDPHAGIAAELPAQPCFGALQATLFDQLAVPVPAPNSRTRSLELPCADLATMSVIADIMSAKYACFSSCWSYSWMRKYLDISTVLRSK